MTKSAARSSTKGFNRIIVSVLFSLWFALGSARSYATEPSNPTPEKRLAPILAYISSGWDNLTRSMMDCQTVIDPKLTEASVLYLPADFPAPAAVQDLQKRCKIQVRPLPAVGTSCTVP